MIVQAIRCISSNIPNNIGDNIHQYTLNRNQSTSVNQALREDTDAWSLGLTDAAMAQMNDFFRVERARYDFSTDGLHTQWASGETLTFPRLWLRDNCTDGMYRKRLSNLNIDSIPAVVEVGLNVENIVPYSCSRG